MSAALAAVALDALEALDTLAANGIDVDLVLDDGEARERWITDAGRLVLATDEEPEPDPFRTGWVRDCEGDVWEVRHHPSGAISCRCRTLLHADACSPESLSATYGPLVAIDPPAATDEETS